RGTREQAVAVVAVGLSGFAAGPLVLRLGTFLGERRGLTLRLIETGAGRVEFAALASVHPVEAPGLLAEVLQLLPDGEGHGHRGEYFDGPHRCLLTGDLLRPLICEAPEKTARGR